jgi:hypothetical protein
MEGLTKLTAGLPLFSRLRKDFQACWWVRFVAYASVWEFLAALQKNGESTLPQSDTEVIDETTSAGKEKAAAKQRNALAMANLTLAFVTEVSLPMVYKAMNNDWPEG